MGAAALPIGIGASGGLFSAYQQAQAGKAQQNYYSYLARNARINAGLATAAGEANVAEVGVQQGQEEQMLVRRTGQTIGAQKAAMAAGGVGIGSKSSEQIIDDTMESSNLDEMALRYNAAAKIKAIRTGALMQALNLQSQAGGYDIAGRNEAIMGRTRAISTILGTGGSVASNWYMRNLKGSSIGYGGYGSGGFGSGVIS